MVVASDNPSREVKGARPVVLDESLGVDLPAALLNVHDMKDTALDSRAEEELDQALLDQINIMYVGMTRPIERLDVLAELKKLDFDRNAPSTVSQWVVACTEEVTGITFQTSGQCVERVRAIDPFSLGSLKQVTLCKPAPWNGKIPRLNQSGWLLEEAPKSILMD